MSVHKPDCGATIYGAFGITPCDCLTSEVQRVADAIRREVRSSAGIQEGQEFRCDWVRVAESVLAERSLIDREVRQ